MPRKGYKKRNCVISTGVAFRPITRAKLELVAAGLDRSVGWVVRDAVDYYLQTQAEPDQYREDFPALAAKLDAEIKAAGGNVDEIYGAELLQAVDVPGIQVVSPGKSLVSPAKVPEQSGKAHEQVADNKINQYGDHLPKPQSPEIESGDARPARGLIGR